MDNPNRSLRRLLGKPSRPEMQSVWRKLTTRGGLIFIVSFVAIAAISSAGYALFLGGSNGPSASNQASSINLQKGLVGWWPMNGNLKDATPYQHTSAISGTVSAGADRENQANAAETFSNSFATETPPINLANIAFTVSAWVKVTTWDTNSSNTQQATIAGSNAGCTTDTCLQLSIRNGHPYFGFFSDDLGGITTINLNQWYLLTFVLTSQPQKLIYVNGVLDSSTTTTNFYNGVFNEVANNCCDVGLQGSLDDVRVYSRALSATEVAALYNQYSPGANSASGENGLVGWWPMNGNAKDSTPYGDNGTVNGATLTTDREGRANSAYSFNGTSSYINFPANSALNSSVFTMVAWVYPTVETSQQNTIIGSSASAGPQFRIDTTGILRLLSENLSSIGVSTVTIPLNTWSQVAVSYDAGGNYAFYVNGQAAGSGTYLLSFTFSNYRIGMQAGNELFTGSITGVRIYNKILTSTQIITQYNSYNSQISLGGSGTIGSVSLLKGLVGQWDMNGNANDSTPYGDNGTVNGATLTTDREGRANSAYSFNGTTNSIYFSDSDNHLIPLANAAFTISMWLDPVSLTTTTCKSILNNETYNVSGFRYCINPSSFPQFWSVESGGTLNFQSSVALSINNWYNIVVIYSGSGGIMYLNGVNVGSATGTIISNNNTFNLGGAIGGKDPFDGSIDGVRVYNRALSAAEVTALYNEYN